MEFKICLIVFKNLAEIEYLIPIIEKNKCSVDIIVFDYSKQNLIHKNSIVSNYCKKNKIKIFDVKDFLKKKSFFLNLLSSKINSKSISIKSLSGALINKFTFEKFALLIQYIFNFVLKKIFNFIFLRMGMTNFADKYDYIFVGHRNFINSFFSSIFKRIFLKKNYKFVLTPHGPHYELKFRRYLLDTENLLLKENYVNIYANNIEKPWLKYYKKSRCIDLGYPPFKYNSNYSEKITTKKKKLLVITRKFDLKENISSRRDGFTTNLNSFTFFMQNLKSVNTSIFEIYLKPHPTTDIKLLRHFLNKNNLSKLKILFDPILFNIRSFDLIYSYHSTLLLLGIANSIPVIYHEDPAVQSNHAWDNKYLDLYKLSYFVQKKNTKLDKYFKNSDYSYDLKKLHKNKLKLFKNFKNFKYENFFNLLNKKFKNI